MATQTFYSDNDTGTMADPLKAVGLAETLRECLLALGRDAAPITIKDEGSFFRIEIPSELNHEVITQVRNAFRAGRGEPLMSKKQLEKAEKEGRRLTGFDYEQHQEQRARYFALLGKLSAADRARFNRNPNQEDFAELNATRPHPDLGLYVYVNHFKIADGYNALLEQWRGQTVDAFQANLALLLNTFSTHPNAVPDKPKVTLLQLVNPSSGKGNNTPKASGLSIGGLDGFWLIEYLKFVGLFTIAAPLMIQESKDRKTYVLHPMKVELGVLRDVMERFRATLYSTTAVKLDIVAALRFSRTLLEYLWDRLATPSSSDPLALFGVAPRVTDIARGFEIAFYKDMGSAYATMNLATINLPDWLGPISSLPVADAALGLLKEHDDVIGGIRSAKGDEGSEEIDLLRRYRDFFSGRESERFFEFAARYGDYYLAKRHRNQWVGQFTTDGMERLMAVAHSKKKFTPILESDGFREIAAAIRRSTVIAQYQAARESGYPFEVRYALGQQLLRAAAYPEEFLAALSEFVQSYNAENARTDERVAKGSLPNLPRNRRASVKTDHLNEIVRLVDQDEYGSEIICKMLVAYGYSRDPFTPAEPAPGGAASDAEK